MSDPHLKVLSDHLDSLLTDMFERKRKEHEVVLNGLGVAIQALLKSLETATTTAHTLGEASIKVLQEYAKISPGQREVFDFTDISETRIAEMLAGCDQMVQHAHAICDPMLDIIKPDASSFGIDIAKGIVLPPKEENQEEEPKSRKSPYIPDGDKYP